MAPPAWLAVRPPFYRRRVLVLSIAAGLLCVVLLGSGFHATAALDEPRPVPGANAEDPRRAAFTGLAEVRVTWFGASLAKRDVAGHAHVVAVPAGQADPTLAELEPAGARFDHTDPRGVTWTSQKYTYGPDLEAWGVPVAGVAHDAALGAYNYLLVFDALDLGATEFDLYVDTDLA